MIVKKCDKCGKILRGSQEPLKCTCSLKIRTKKKEKVENFYWTVGSIDLYGVGSELAELIPKTMAKLIKLFSRKGDCGCNSLMRQMNLWGPDGCEYHRDFIVGKLESSAMKLGIPKKFSRPKAHEWLTKAIRKTREKYHPETL